MTGEFRTSKTIQKTSVKHTFTICGAAASADMPRQQSRTVSAFRASQTPSLLIISLQPALESCINRKKRRKSIKTKKVLCVPNGKMVKVFKITYQLLRNVSISTKFFTCVFSMGAHGHSSLVFSENKQTCSNKAS